jgi:hypothetical protein
MARTQALIAELLALWVDVLVTGDFALILAHTLLREFRLSALRRISSALVLRRSFRSRAATSRACRCYRPNAARNGSNS